MNKIIKNELKKSLQRLNENMDNKMYFRTNQLEIISNSEITENFLGKNRRYSYYSNCCFVNCNFEEAGFSGSIFIECSFVDCNFDFSNFQSCDFRFCIFKYTTIKKKKITGTRFMKSIFFECEFDNILFNSTNFCESILNGKIINNCNFHSCAFEDMVLKNILLKQIRFYRQSFDFLKIDNIKTDDVVFPFPAIPCITNGLKYVIDTSDAILFTSENASRLSKTEYLSYIPDFITFYRESKNYYFLANILISLKNKNEAITAIEFGVLQALETHNFRMVKHFSQLLNNCQFNIQDRKKIYNLIIVRLDKLKLNNCDFDNLNMYLGDIKSLILNNSDNPYLTLDVQTNIESSNYKEINYFYKYLETMLQLYVSENEYHNIEIRHNSDTCFFIEIFSDPERLIVFLAAFFDCCAFSYAFTKKLINKVKEIYNKKKQKSDLDDSPFTKEQLEAIKELIEGKKKMEMNKNIEIKEVHHHIYNTENIDIDINLNLKLSYTSNKNNYIS